jgi:hypothetical protein
VSRTRFARVNRLSVAARIFCFGSVGLGATIAYGQSPANPPVSSTPPVQSERSTDEPTPIASTRSSGSTNSGSIPAPKVLRASARLEGTPSPGLRVTLDGSASSGGRMWYRWLQTQGPKVSIEDATRPEANFTVPADASLLGFVLVVGNATGVDAVSLLVEVDDPDREADSQTLKADAGDDQSSKVGRRVVLNGVRSEPKGNIRYRWIQTSGPKVALRTGEGPTASFIPASSGTYQFALIVATGGGLLSEASTVTVNVGGTVRASVDGPSMAIDELARVSLASIEGGSKYADDLSKAFDLAADGMNSYRTFAEAIAEMTRRLDAVVPRDKERRAVWIERMFSPLMAKMVAGMKEDGLDLSQPEAQSKPLTKTQRTRLAEQFRYTAAGIRASRTMR